MPSKDREIRARVDEGTHQLLDDLCELRGMTKSDVLRQALREYADRCRPAVVLVEFEGTPEILEKKHQAIELGRRRKGPAMVAREVGVTYREFKRWLHEDEVFADFWEWARDETVESVEHNLWVKANDNDVLSAQFGFLNTHHEKWGMISKSYLKREMARFIEKKVVPAVRKFLSPEGLLSLSTELRALPEQHFREGA